MWPGIGGHGTQSLVADIRLRNKAFVGYFDIPDFVELLRWLTGLGTEVHYGLHLKLVAVFLPVLNRSHQFASSA